MSQLYLYGITEQTHLDGLSLTGVGGERAVRIAEGSGLGCVVSEYSGPDVRELPREAMLSCLLRHQQVLERVMEQASVLPVKFGTTIDSGEVGLLLAQGRAPLAGAVASIEGKVEIEVAAIWDTQRVLEEIGREEGVLLAKEAIVCKGRPSREEQVHLGQMVKASMDRRRRRYQERIAALLGPMAAAVAPNALLSDAMVLNVAFWVERSRQEEFDQGLHQLDALFDHEITLRVIGPLPPYSFRTVEMRRLAWSQLEEACRLLRLGDVLSERAIRDAYRRLAAERHRGLASWDGPIAAELSMAQRASELLLRWCRAGAVPPEGINRRLGAGRGDAPLFAVEIRGAAKAEIDPSRFGVMDLVRQGGK